MADFVEKKTETPEEEKVTEPATAEDAAGEEEGNANPEVIFFILDLRFSVHGIFRRNQQQFLFQEFIWKK
jgi:hypothetical protein